MAAGPIRIAILANASQAKREVDATQSRFEKFNSKMGSFANKVKVPLTIAAAGAVAFGKSAIDAASNAEQSIGATQSIYGKYADNVIKSSEKAAKAVGLSANEYRESANLMGSLFKGQGVSMDELAGKTDKFVSLGADLAATYGGSVPEAVGALTSAFKGEFDPLERYGISLKKSDVNARAAAMAQKEYGKKLKDLSSEQQKAIENEAAQALVMERSKDAQGQFARESDTLAGKQAVLGAQFDDMKAKLGDKLMPVVVDITEKLVKLTDWASENPAVVKAAAIAIGVVLVMAFTSWAASIWAANAALLANPITWVVLAIVALIAIIVLVIMNFDKIKAAVGAAWDWVKTKTAEAWNAFKTWVVNGINTAVGFIKGLPGKAKAALSSLGSRIKSTAVSAFNSLKSAVTSGVTTAVNKVKELPGKAKSALGNLGSKLKSVGKDLIQGFINGIGEMFSKVKGKLGDLTGKLTSWKGPEATDKKLLTPAGQMLIEGLMRGIDARRKALKKQLGNVTSDIESAVSPQGGEFAALGLSLSASGTSSQPAGVVINVSVAPTADKASIGREIASALDSYYRAGGRRA